MAFWNGGAPGVVFLGLSHVEYFLGTTESMLPFFHISSHSLKVAVMISDAAFFSNKLTYPFREVSIQKKKKAFVYLGLFSFVAVAKFICLLLYFLFTPDLDAGKLPETFALLSPPRNTHINMHRSEPCLFSLAPLSSSVPAF